jgi:hypothetical protein
VAGLRRGCADPVWGSSARTGIFCVAGGSLGCGFESASDSFPPVGNRSGSVACDNRRAEFFTIASDEGVVRQIERPILLTRDCSDCESVFGLSRG